MFETVSIAVGFALSALTVVGIFGGSDDHNDLSGVARRLGTREDITAIERQLDALEDAVDTLVANADLDRHLQNPPAADATPVEKAAALSQAVDRDQLSVCPRDSAPDTGTFASIATRTRRERSPTSGTARQLLDQASAPSRADPNEIARTLDRTIESLDVQDTLKRALQDEDDVQALARNARNQLAHEDDPIVTSVRQLAEAIGRTSPESHESARTPEDAVNTITAAAADALDVDIGPDSDRSTNNRLRVLADALDRNELGFGPAEGDRVSTAATAVSRSQNPQSAVAKRLLDRLASPELGDLETTLETVVQQLDQATTTRSIAAGLDHETVFDLADDVKTELADQGGPVANTLVDRVTELRGILDRANESNKIIPYAVRQELKFYDRTLVGVAGESSSASAESFESDNLSLSTVADRRASIEKQYVDGRRDHNHSIPLHFLSLVDILLDEAETAAAEGDANRSSGLLDAADRTISHVEQLYERNEYSVMLRRLRG